MIKRIIKFLTSRLFLIMFLMFIQLNFLMLAIYKIGELGLVYYVVFNSIGSLFSFSIMNRDFNPAYKISWIIAIIAVPFVGVVFYAIFGRLKMGKKTIKRINQITENSRKFYNDNQGFSDFENSSFKKIHNYLTNVTYMPAWNNTRTKFLSPGEDYFITLLEKLRNAKKSIFLEFFIIFPGKMWDQINEIIVEKVKQGVEVRIIYDDFGCLKKMKKDFKKNLIKNGIKVATFNPLIPILSITINYRDHRKIVVIDGEVGFLGGANIGDEYINIEKPFGYWKDSMIMVEGQGTINLLKLFLQMWMFCTKEELNYKDYQGNLSIPSNGQIQIYGDGPFDGYTINESIYLNIINGAKKYVYITTPYLILDNEILSALKLSALSGIDVRIIVPHIPDKKLVFLVTQSYYAELITAGVRIYEYLPGFIHAKGIVADDELGVVGSTNFDYRSLYLHFESSCLLYETDSINEIKKDFLETATISKEIYLDDCIKKNKNIFKRIFVSILKAFSPMM